MLSWVVDNAANIAVSLLILAVFLAVTLRGIRNLRAGRSSCGSCSGCANRGNCPGSKKT